MGVSSQQESPFVMKKALRSDKGRRNPSSWMVIRNPFNFETFCMDFCCLDNIGLAIDDFESRSVLDETTIEASTLDSTFFEGRTRSCYTDDQNNSLDTQIEKRGSKIKFDTGGKKLMLTKNESRESYENRDEESKQLILLADHSMEGQSTHRDHDQKEEEDSRTLNTLSTMKLTPSLDTKTLDSTLIGLRIMKEKRDKTETAKQRKNDIFPSFSLQSLFDYRIERVPLVIDLGSCSDDNSSVVSSISVEDERCQPDTDTTERQERETKQFVEGKSKLSPFPLHFNKSSTSTNHPILHTKSIDFTATTICTDDYYYEDNNVPFDEPQNHVSSPRLLRIEEIQFGP